MDPVIKGALAAILFTISGVLTAGIFVVPNSHDGFINLAILATPIPYAIASALLYVGDSGVVEALGSVSLVIGSWLAAYCIAFTSMFIFGPYPGLLPAGAVGGLGIAVATGFHSPALNSRTCRVTASIIGGVLGLLCGNLILMPAQPNLGPARIGFALWQSAVGTYLYAMALQPQKKEPVTPNAR